MLEAEELSGNVTLGVDKIELAKDDKLGRIEVPLMGSPVSVAVAEPEVGDVVSDAGRVDEPFKGVEEPVTADEGDDVVELPLFGRPVIADDPELNALVEVTDDELLDETSEEIGVADAELKLEFEVEELSLPLLGKIVGSDETGLEELTPDVETGNEAEELTLVIGMADDVAFPLDEILPMSDVGDAIDVMLENGAVTDEIRELKIPELAPVRDELAVSLVEPLTGRLVTGVAPGLLVVEDNGVADVSLLLAGEVTEAEDPAVGDEVLPLPVVLEFEADEGAPLLLAAPVSVAEVVLLELFVARAGVVEGAGGKTVTKMVSPF